MAQRIKICTTHELAPGKHAEFPFTADDRKILLSNVAGQIYATSAKCTHYGAPLAKGVLASDGRVTCPWHGACFKVQTGDIEDAPALDSLLSFPVEIEGSDVYVTADPEKLQGKPGLAFECKEGAAKVDTSAKGVVIVGGGAAAIHAVESARKNGYTGSLTILSSEPYGPIDRTKLSKALIADPSAVQWRSKAHLTQVLGVSLRENSTVSSVDVAASTVTLDGGEKVAYTHLILATGGTPKRLPIEGKELEGVLTLRQIQDTAAINEALGSEGDKDVVIIGTSFIGMEGAIAIAGGKKAKSVHVVGMESVPFEAVLGKDVGRGLMEAQAEKNQLQFHMQSGVVRFDGADGKVRSVVIKEKGQEVTLPADVVILGVGVAPATSYLADSPGFPQLRKDGSVAVNADFRVTGLEDANVFAVGDIAAVAPTQGGDNVRIEHWNVASNHGRHVGALIAGATAPYTRLPVFWSALGAQLRYVSDGRQQKFDVVHVQGQPKDLQFSAFYAKAGSVTAVATMGTDPLMVHCAELLRQGKMPSLADIQGGKNPLDIPL